MVFFIVLIVMPTAKKIIFPDTITRMEKMLRRSTFTNCSLSVFRKDEVSLLLKVTAKGENPFTTEVCKYFWNELSIDQGRVFFTHTINRHPDDRWYLDQTEIWADADLKQVRKLDVKFCDRLEGDGANMHYKDHRPIFKCAVPLQEATCLATPAPVEN